MERELVKVLSPVDPNIGEIFCGVIADIIIPFLFAKLKALSEMCVLYLKRISSTGWSLKVLNQMFKELNHH